MQRIRIIISGLVQGVFFRQFIKENADKLNIKGYAKNTVNEKVEAVFEGKKEDLEKILDLCKKGPVSAKINRLEVIKEKYKNEYKTFEIIR